ncbi:hypothetical protein B0T19DRAFT_349001, partial [Cercophora scortea]
AMADAAGLHRCNVCFKTYKRREHLQRHRSSHSAIRPHRCILCPASFQRTDVLKRHLQTCDGATNSSYGRRRACDRCVRQKKACSSSQPCQNCARRGVQCVYSNPAASTGGGPSTSGTVAGSTASDVMNTGYGDVDGDDDGDVSQGLDHSSSHTLHPDPHSQNHTHNHNPCQINNPQLNQHDIQNIPFGHQDVHFDDLDALIHEAVSSFPLLSNPHDIGDNWLDMEFTSVTTPPATAETSSSHRGESKGSPIDDYPGYSFSFLYDFTSRTGLVSSFDCATLAQREQIVALSDHSYLQQQPEYYAVDLPLSVPIDEMTHPPGPAHAAAAGVLAGHGLVSWSSWLHNPIVVKLQHVVLLIKDLVTVKPHNSTVTLTWSPALEQKCLHFFSPSRFTRFLDLYWSVWHPNICMIHRPSFDPTTCKSVLLAAMALIGACISPDPKDNEDARTWFNCVEEMVFTDADFCSDTEPGSPVDDAAAPTSVLGSRRKLQALQAAYVVCLYQNWEGSDASKRRIRRHRYGTVVSVARDLEISSARHLDYSKQLKHDFQWIEYVVRDELIRTFLCIFLLDTAFVIFNNLPHRMVIKEMKMHMASPDACFQAPTAETCIEELHEWMKPSGPFCNVLLSEAIQSVCSESLTPDSHQKLSQLGPLNMFAIVSAFHLMIFQHQNLLGVEGQLVPIRNGLRNWKTIWELYFGTWSSSPPHGTVPLDSLTPDNMWKRIGFCRHSHEYWLLGSLITDRISSTASKATESRNEASLAQTFLGDPTLSTQAKSISAEPILEKYDQTSMRQVNDLIADFQRVQID